MSESETYEKVDGWDYLCNAWNKEDAEFIVECIHNESCWFGTVDQSDCVIDDRGTYANVFVKNCDKVNDLWRFVDGVRMALKLQNRLDTVS